MHEAVAEVTEFLRDRGLRVTAARGQIIETVLELGGHFSADELLAAVSARGHRASRASVYRTLALLVDGGFVESREFQRGQLAYEVMVGHVHHDHLICNACGRIVEFENDEIEQLQDDVAEAHGFTLESHSLRLFGRCADCR